MNRLSIMIGVSLLLLAPSAFSQSPPPANSKAAPGVAKGSDKSETKLEAERIRKGRQEQARALLFSLSGEARGFRDQKLRARSLARITDALWDVAVEQGRATFREAWDAAHTADRESAGRLNLRGEVLRLAAKRDRLLAEEFLQKLKVEQESKAAPVAAVSVPTGSKIHGAQTPVAALRAARAERNCRSLVFCCGIVESDCFPTREVNRRAPPVLARQPFYWTISVTQ
jgi:hypothetical protein